MSPPAPFAAESLPLVRSQGDLQLEVTEARALSLRPIMGRGGGMLLRFAVRQADRKWPSPVLPAGSFVQSGLRR